MLLKLAICDDTALCRRQAEEAVKAYVNKNEECALSVEVFSHAEDLLEAAHKNGGYDIYLLDIVMPHINGIELGKMLRNDGYNGRIIYLTSEEDFALDSYKVKAQSYLLKPINTEELFAAIDEAVLASKSKNEKSLIVKTKKNSVKLSYDDIMYAELSRRAVVYHLASGRTVDGVTLRVPFAEAVAELARDPRFVICGQGTVVNLRHITMVGNDELVFVGKYKLPIGVKLCRELRSTWTSYWFESEAKL